MNKKIWTGIAISLAILLGCSVLLLTRLGQKPASDQTKMEAKQNNSMIQPSDQEITESEPPATETQPTDPVVTEAPATEPVTTQLQETNPMATTPPEEKPAVTQPQKSVPTQPKIPETATQPPVTEPPIPEPPVTEPPVTEPPVTEPPVTEPPVTESPVTEPPVTEPPVTEPPVTEPPVTEPPVTEPPVTEPPKPERQEPKAPDFTVYDSQGRKVRLSDYFGKPIVLNFWASWCGPCRSEMPDFQEKYTQQGTEVQFLMVNMTAYETLEGATAFIREQGYTFPVFYDRDAEAAYAYNVHSLPTTYFIDREGYLMAQAVGAINAHKLQEGIDRIT